MKKFISLFTCILILMFCSVIHATTTFTATLETDKSILKAGDEIEIALKLENFTENEKGINVLLGILDYDKSIFEKVEQEDITSIQYWEAPTFNTDNGKLLLDTYTFVSESHNAVKIKLKVKDNITETKTTEIKLKEIVASDGENDIEVEDAIVTLQVEKSTNSSSATNGSMDNKIVYMVIIILAIIILGSIIIVAFKRKNN